MQPFMVEMQQDNYTTLQNIKHECIRFILVSMWKIIGS